MCPLGAFESRSTDIIGWITDDGIKCLGPVRSVKCQKVAFIQVWGRTGTELVKDLFADFRTRFVDFNEEQHALDDVFGAL